MREIWVFLPKFMDEKNRFKTRRVNDKIGPQIPSNSMVRP